MNRLPLAGRLLFSAVVLCPTLCWGQDVPIVTIRPCGCVEHVTPFPEVELESQFLSMTVSESGMTQDGAVLPEITAEDSAGPEPVPTPVPEPAPQTADAPVASGSAETPVVVLAGIWVTGVLLAPWLLSSVLQLILRSESLLLQALTIALWMLLVAGSSWFLWGTHLPLQYTLTLLPILGIATPYFAAVCEWIDPLTLDSGRPRHE